MSVMMILFLAGLTALAFVVVTVRHRQTSRPLRVILLCVATAIVAYIGWIFLSPLVK